MTKLQRESLLIISNSVGGGGAENAMFALYRELHHEIPTQLIALNTDQTSSKQEEGIIVLNRKWGGGFLSTFSTFLSLNRVIYKSRATWIIVNCELAELLIALSPPFRAKIVCVEHTSNPWIGRKGIGFAVRKILGFRNANWVTVSRNSSSVWQSRRLAKHIPNPVQVPMLGKFQRNAGAVFIGRLVNGKRPEWAVLASSKAKIELNVFGNGPLLEELVDLQRSLNSSANFHGYVENCWESISSDDVLLMPSAFEGDGIVVVQAILAGMRILLSDNADLRRFDLPDECYVGSAEEMAEKLVQLDFLDEAKFRAGKVQTEKLMLERNIENVSAEWLRYLRRI